MRIISREEKIYTFFFPQHDYKSFFLLSNAFQNHNAVKIPLLPLLK